MNFEMDNYMADLTEDFDFDAFLNFPPDDLDQGGEDGEVTLPNTQSETNNTSKIGADNLYANAAGANGNLYAPPLKTTGSEMIAMNGCGETCSTAPVQEPSWPPASNPLNNSSSQKNCTCIGCLKIAKDCYKRPWTMNKGFKCGFPTCLTFPFGGSDNFYAHEKSHYGQPGAYMCLVQGCQVIFKNFGDLKRHDKAKHCTNPNKERFPCPVLWCKYSGNNGFARKDKLKSHYKNIHEGKPGPAKAGRVLKPATLRPKVSGPEGSASKQEEQDHY